MKTGNGSIYSTTENLYKFDRMLVDRTILNDSSVKKLFTEHFPTIGYGWFVSEIYGSPRISLGGRSPGFGSYWVRLVDDDLTVIVLGNLYNGVPVSIGGDLVAMVLGEAFEPPVIRFEVPDPELLAELVGAYQFGPDFYRPNAAVRFHIRDGHLFNGLDWAIPAGDMKFVHRIYWSDLEFKRDATGEVDRLRYDDFVGTRIR